MKTRILVISILSAFSIYSSGRSFYRGAEPKIPEAEITIPDQTSGKEVVNIEFSNIISGFKVKAIWIPRKVIYDHVVGPAIITFQNVKDSAVFDITTDHFSISKSRLPFIFTEDGYEIAMVNRNSISMLYETGNLTSNESFGTTKEPFFFEDVNFDGNKELLIVEVGNGQRDVASFKAYNFDFGEVQLGRFGITFTEPFRSLDEMSVIDHIKKSLTIYNSSGYCSSNYDIYKLRGGQLLLDTIIQEESDESSGKCYELIYKVSSQGQKQLISKKEKSN